MDKKRTIMPNGRYTDDELELLKSVFAENLPLIKTLRKVMLGLDMSEAEEIQWKNTFHNNEVLMTLMRKMFLPEIDGDAPIHQIVDLHLTLDLNNKLPDELDSIIKARVLLINYLNKRLKYLAGGKEESTYLKISDFEVNEVNLRSRRDVIMHIENQLAEINGLAGYKQETPEETIKRLEQNSNK